MSLLDDVFFGERKEPALEVDRLGQVTVRARLSAGASIEVLGDLARLRRVDLKGATAAHVAELARRASSVDVLILRRPRLDSLEVVTSFNRLKALRVDDATKVTTLPPLAKINGLQTLALENLPRITSLAPMSGARTLEEFSFATLLSRTTPQLVDSLNPLGSVPLLRVLRFGGVVARDRLLQPLWGLRNLEEVQIPNHYPVEQVGRLVGAHPALTGWGITATTPTPLACKRCGERNRVQLIGGRPRFACRSCDSALVIKHGLDFQRWTQTAT